MLAPLSFLLQQKRIPSSYLLLMQPGSGAPFTVPYTSPGTWASRAASSRGSAHPAVALCPPGSVPSCILQCDLHQIPSHHLSRPKTLLPGHQFKFPGSYFIVHLLSAANTAPGHPTVAIGRRNPLYLGQGKPMDLAVMEEGALQG